MCRGRCAPPKFPTSPTCAFRPREASHSFDRMGLTISRLGSPSPAALQTPSPATADIIFLDIDGVLNSRSTRENGDHLPDDALLSNLKHAIMHAHRSCLIVLSSTWRLDEALRRPLAEHLLRAGLSIYGFTPDLEKEHTGDRVDEIRAWLQVHCGAMKEEELMAIPWVAIDDLCACASVH